MSLNAILRALPAGEIAVLAGAGFHDGVPAREAPAGWPIGVARRPDGDLIVNDYWGNRIWRIDRDGILHLFGGDGTPGTDGDGGPVAAARFREPHDLHQDRHGNLYLSDLGNHTIRRIDYRTGIVTLVAGSSRIGRGGDGGPAVDAELDCTCGVAVDAGGNVYLSDEWACNIRRVDARTGIIDLFAGYAARHYPSEQGSSRPFAGAGLSLMGYHGDGGPASHAAFYHPEHLAFDSRGDLYVCDNSNDRVRRIDMRTGIITTVLGNGQRASNGDGGPAVEASTLMPDAICLDVPRQPLRRREVRLPHPQGGSRHRSRHHRGRHRRARVGRGRAARQPDGMQLRRGGDLGRPGRHRALGRLLRPAAPL